jgi:uncharacterized membrane protein YeiH
MPRRIASADHLLLVVDLAAVTVFAVEGALVAVDVRLDVVGVLVLAFATALAGGIIRDLLIGAVPPASIVDQRYPIATLAAGAVVFCLHGLIDDVPSGLLDTLDAAGLSLFAVAGADKALLHRIGPVVAVLLGAVTAVGGGTVRDLLIGEVPAVLRIDVYATAALLGAAVMVAGVVRGLPRAPMMAAGAACCFVLRMLAVWQGWSLPHA